MKTHTCGLIPSMPLRTIKRSASSATRFAQTRHSTLEAVSVAGFKLGEIPLYVPGHVSSSSRLLKTSSPIRFYGRFPSSGRLVDTPNPQPTISLPTPPPSKTVPQMKFDHSNQASYPESLLKFRTLQPHRRAVELNLLQKVRDTRRKRLML